MIGAVSLSITSVYYLYLFLAGRTSRTSYFTTAFECSPSLSLPHWLVTRTRTSLMWSGIPVQLLAVLLKLAHWPLWNAFWEYAALYFTLWGQYVCVCVRVTVLSQICDNKHHFLKCVFHTYHTTCLFVNFQAYCFFPEFTAQDIICPSNQLCFHLI